MFKILRDTLIFGSLCITFSSIYVHSKKISEFLPFHQEIKAEPKDLIFERVHQASELITAKREIQVLIPVVYTNKIIGHTVGETSYTYKAVGEVSAGVELTNFKKDNISIANQTVVITPPPTQILNIKLNVSKSQIFGYKRDWFAPEITLDQQQQIQSKALEVIKAKACKEDILESSNRHFTKTLIELITPLTSKQIIVNTSIVSRC